MRTDLALPPAETDESFVREVDENLRRDQAQDFLKKNGAWIVGALLLFLAAIAGWLYWQDRQVKQAEAETERLNSAMAQIGGGQAAAGAQQLEPLLNSDADGVRGAARLTKAAVALEKADRKTAIAEYRGVMEDGDLPQPYRDLARIRQTALEFDALPPATVIDRMKPLAVAGGPWFGSAGETRRIFDRNGGSA